MNQSRHHAWRCPAPRPGPPPPPPGFATCTPAQLADPASAAQWLIDPLWPDQACGIIGGEPKCGKSLLALSFAVAVASGHTLFDRFAVHAKGPVLIYPAEDAERIVRNRIRAICQYCRVAFDTIDIRIIQSPQLRLDHSHHQDMLRGTIMRTRPRLLILDPLTRLHRVNENLTCEVSPMLDYLRQLQRNHHCAVMVIHHTRKSSHNRCGQTLRGTSDLHAWGDSNLYLSRSQNQLLELRIEHRAAPSPTSLKLKMHQQSNGPALHMTNQYRPVSTT